MRRCTAGVLAIGLLGCRAPGPEVRSAVEIEDLDASDGITGFVEPLDPAGAPQHLIPPSPAEQAFNDAHYGDDCLEQPCGARFAVWPSEPFFDEARNRALVFYGLIYAEPGDFNFEGVGRLIYDAGDDAPYDAMHHPECEEDEGRVQYITYSRHTTGWFGTEFPIIRVEFVAP